MDRILVTGGAGYIGSHACKALAAAGFEPISLDNLVYGHESSVKWGPLEHGDISDAERLDEVFSTHRPMAVMHFAAYAYVGESVSDPAKYYANNVTGTLALLEAMRRHEVRNIVFSSTCATYGNPRRLPLTEDHPQAPINPYGRTKLAIEWTLEDYCSAYGMNAVALRYFNAAGADPDAETGEDHDPETHLIPLVLEAAAGRRPHISIFGDDYDTPDGTCIRDYIHVTDLADAHLRALRALDKGEGFAAYNLGNEVGVSVKEVIDVARRVTGKDIPVEMAARRPGDPARLVADSAKAHAELGWRAGELSRIERIIETAWNWHQANW
jgi:UDP-arabinose 4-epimerase